MVDDGCMTADADLGLDWSGLAIMAPEDCYDRLRHAHVGRLGFMDEGEVVILPVNIALDGRSIVFRTGIGAKLSSAVMAKPVCVEIDDWDDFEHTGWSVLARGVAAEVLDDDRIARLVTLPVRPWTNPEVRDHWVSVTVQEITGRRIARPVSGIDPARS
jgi:nitroimidazol reductase NimA-like FMN-containing flavoprotein (pyridoxamine 5'-phosphate oxidase superfamily)